MNRTTAKESRLNYTAHGIKGKNGEAIGGIGNKVNYLPAYYDFDTVRLEIRLTLKGYASLEIIPHGCNVRNDSDYMADYYDKDKLTIPATAGAEFLAAAIGYKKYIDVMRKRGTADNYARGKVIHFVDYEKAVLELAEQIASCELENGTEIIAERIKTDAEQRERARIESNKKFAADLLKEGNKNGQTVEKIGDKVIYRRTITEQIFDGKIDGWGRTETLETVIAINIKTGEREQIQSATLAEAYEFYKKVTA